MAYQRYKFFINVPVIQWGKGMIERQLTVLQAFYVLSKVDEGGWGVAVPMMNNEHEFQYKKLDDYTITIGAPKLRVAYPFKTFREAFMATKEMKEIYANLPIAVVQGGHDEPHFIGTSNAEEVAAVLTYE